MVDDAAVSNRSVQLKKNVGTPRNCGAAEMKQPPGIVSLSFQDTLHGQCDVLMLARVLLNCCMLIDWNTVPLKRRLVCAASAWEE